MRRWRPVDSERKKEYDDSTNAVTCIYTQMHIIVTYTCVCVCEGNAFKQYLLEYQRMTSSRLQTALGLYDINQSFNAQDMFQSSSTIHVYTCGGSLCLCANGLLFLHSV